MRPIINRGVIVRILVFSDSHGSIRNCIKVIKKIDDVDMILHLGDIVSDAEDLQILYPHIPIEYICGNNDYSKNVPREKVLDIKGKKIFITHGHYYRVKNGYETILEKALSLNVDVALFGHTHEPYEANHKGIHLLNPGSIRLPNRGTPTYGIIEIEKDKLGKCICSV